jgi:hypothetical protein
MTTAPGKPLLELLKDLSALLVGAAALLYVFGFAAHWAYFRLLGIDINGQAFDYLRFAADYVTAVVGALPQLLFAFVYYAPKLIDSLLLKITILCFLIALLAIALYVRPLKLSKVRKGRLSIVLWWALNVLIVASWWLLCQTELDMAKVRDILQPIDAADVQQMQARLSDPGSVGNAALLEVRGRDVGRVYEKYTQTQKGEPGYQYFNTWFNPTIAPHNSSDRRAVYLALLLLNLILLFAAIVQLVSLRTANVDDNRVNVHQRIGLRWSRLVIVMLAVGLAIQMFLFPFVYATVGRNLTYPIVRLKLTPLSEGSGSESKSEESSQTQTNATTGSTKVAAATENWTHSVYLIVDRDNEVVVFDRLNFFQVKRVPRSRILTVSQVFSASPFESCSKDQGIFTPCETLWISEQTPVLDF